MINNKRVVALIPARGGSKSIPKKNIVSLAGKPLIGWSIELAKDIEEIDRVIVSTDSEDIAKVAINYGVEVQMRPGELAKDDSLVIDTINYVIKKIKNEGETAEYLILLEPTAPLRAKEDVCKCIRLLDEKNYDSVATFTEATLNPNRAWKIIDGEPEVFIKGAIPWLPRQKLPKAYQLNGAVYAAKIDKIEGNMGLLFGKIGAIVMPRERSIDIDDKIDLLVAEALINGR